MQHTSSDRSLTGGMSHYSARDSSSYSSGPGTSPSLGGYSPELGTILPSHMDLFLAAFDWSTLSDEQTLYDVVFTYPQNLLDPQTLSFFLGTMSGFGSHASFEIQKQYLEEHTIDHHHDHHQHNPQDGEEPSSASGHGSSSSDRPPPPERMRLDYPSHTVFVDHVGPIVFVMVSSRMLLDEHMDYVTRMFQYHMSSHLDRCVPQASYVEMSQVLDEIVYGLTSTFSLPVPVLDFPWAKPYLCPGTLNLNALNKAELVVQQMEAWPRFLTGGVFWMDRLLLSHLSGTLERFVVNRASFVRSDTYADRRAQYEASVSYDEQRENVRASMRMRWRTFGQSKEQYDMFPVYITHEEMQEMRRYRSVRSRTLTTSFSTNHSTTTLGEDEDSMHNSSHSEDHGGHNRSNPPSATMGSHFVDGPDGSWHMLVLMDPKLADDSSLMKDYGPQHRELHVRLVFLCRTAEIQMSDLRMFRKSLDPYLHSLRRALYPLMAHAAPLTHSDVPVHVVSYDKALGRLLAHPIHDRETSDFVMEHRHMLERHPHVSRVMYRLDNGTSRMSTRHGQHEVHLESKRDVTDLPLLWRLGEATALHNLNEYLPP